MGVGILICDGWVNDYSLCTCIGGLTPAPAQPPHSVLQCNAFTRHIPNHSQRTHDGRFWERQSAWSIIMHWVLYVDLIIYSLILESNVALLRFFFKRLLCITIVRCSLVKFIVACLVHCSLMTVKRLILTPHLGYWFIPIEISRSPVCLHKKNRQHLIKNLWCCIL